MAFLPSCFRKWRTHSSLPRDPTRPQRFVTPSVGPSNPKAFRLFAPHRSSNFSSATSGDREVEFWRCAVTHRSRVRPTFRLSTTFYPATCRCRAVMAPKRRSVIIWPSKQSQPVFGTICPLISSASSRPTTGKTRLRKITLATIGFRRSRAITRSLNISTTWPTAEWKACLSWARTRPWQRQIPALSEWRFPN